MDRDNRWDRVKKSFDAIAYAHPSTSCDILTYLK
jgi:2,3-bisphosphoglycerate-independent phosphoglycerate mutase